KDAAQVVGQIGQHNAVAACAQLGFQASRIGLVDGLQQFAQGRLATSFQGGTASSHSGIAGSHHASAAAACSAGGGKDRTGGGVIVDGIDNVVGGRCSGGDADGECLVGGIAIVVGNRLVPLGDASILDVLNAHAIEVAAFGLS